MMMKNSDFEGSAIKNLCEYMSIATCNFTAVDLIANLLEENNFCRLEESDRWSLLPNGKYYVVKNDSAIFPFIVGTGDVAEAGFHIISAHSDSPCFKIKPNCEIYGDGGVVTLNVEKYGCGILYTWFDRPLSAAGRVMLKGEDALHPISLVVDFGLPIATIPHLAIHFNRAVNEGNPLSVQKDMKPVVGYFSPEKIEMLKKSGGVIKNMIADFLSSDTDTVYVDDILDYELSLYPINDPELIGVNQEYLQSGRIDDLSMVFAGLEALFAAADTTTAATRILAIFDNEETGSATKQGAHSPVLRHIMERICMPYDDSETIYRALSNSFMISADDAHAWHPNYNEKYDPTNHPVAGGGPVVKINANCKYMTDAHGAAVFHALCNDAGVNMQYFVNHSDVAGGSTLGNISSVQVDIPGVDVGVAIWGMHSAAETMAVSDHIDMIRVFAEFYCK
jgi:aspartyl aminopeptidase